MPGTALAVASGTAYGVIMGPRRTVLLVFAVLSALALCCAAPALALEPAGDGWYWQLPQPQGQALDSVTMSGEKDVWATGAGGVILHSSDGGVSWAIQDRPSPIRSPTSPSPMRGTAAPWAATAGAPGSWIPCG